MLSFGSTLGSSYTVVCSANYAIIEDVSHVLLSKSVSFFAFEQKWIVNIAYLDMFWWDLVIYVSHVYHNKNTRVHL